MGMQSTITSVIKSVQRGSTSLAGFTGTAAVSISAVNVSKSYVVISVADNIGSAGSSSGNSEVGVAAQLSATQITFVRQYGNLTAGAATIYWQVIEYY